MTFYQARFESWRFDFQAFGESEEKAIEALKKGLDQHSISYQIESNWWHDYECDIYTVELEFGGCYRDNDRIWGNK
jgi:hypothetical protein